MITTCIPSLLARWKKQRNSRSIGAKCAQRWKSFLFFIRPRIRLNFKGQSPREERKRGQAVKEKLLTNRLPCDMIKSLRGNKAQEKGKMKNEKDYCYFARDARRRNPLYARRLQRSIIRHKRTVLRGGRRSAFDLSFSVFLFSGDNF